ncbi:MAG TPA: hypothetical protein VGF94_18320 [Kofleriaceae bacterium]|jgi:hypothetical protein
MKHVIMLIACGGLAAACTHTRASASPVQPLGLSTAPAPSNPDIPNPDAAGVPEPNQPTPPVSPPITSIEPTGSTAALH